MDSVIHLRPDIPRRWEHSNSNPLPLPQSHPLSQNHTGPSMLGGRRKSDTDTRPFREISPSRSSHSISQSTSNYSINSANSGSSNSGSGDEFTNSDLLLTSKSDQFNLYPSENVIQTLFCYVPKFIKRRFLKDPQPPSGPSLSKMNIATLVIDVCGFSALADRMAKQYSFTMSSPSPMIRSSSRRKLPRDQSYEKLNLSLNEGEEKLTRILNTYFTNIVSYIESNGGDIVKFAGDAVIAIWYDRFEGERQDNIPLEEIRKIISSTAIACAIDINNYLQNFRFEIDDVTLSCKLTIGMGESTLLCVGGVDAKYELVLTGEPLDQIINASEHAMAGTIVVSKQAMEDSQHVYKAEAINSEFFLLKKHNQERRLGRRIPR